MTPVSPVIEGLEQFEIVFGADQPEYSPLTALVGELPERNVISRWQLTDDERAAIAAGADIFTGQMTFGDMFQPLKVFVGSKQADAQEFMRVFGIGSILPSEKISAEALDKLLG